MPGRRFRADSLNLLRGAERFPPLPENTPFAAVHLSHPLFSPKTLHSGNCVSSCAFFP